MEFFEDITENRQYLSPLLLPDVGKEERDNFSQLASGFFVKASMAAPSSVTAQGALIAQYCQEKNIQNPGELGACLLADTERIDRLTNAANKIHNHSQKGPDEINARSIEGIVRTDFSTAQSFISYPPEKLHYITTKLYPLMKDYTSDISHREKLFLSIVTGERPLPRFLGVRKKIRNVFMKLGEQYDLGRDIRSD